MRVIQDGPVFCFSLALDSQDSSRAEQGILGTNYYSSSNTSPERLSKLRCYS